MREKKGLGAVKPLLLCSDRFVRTNRLASRTVSVPLYVRHGEPESSLSQGQLRFRSPASLRNTATVPCMNTFDFSSVVSFHYRGCKSCERKKENTIMAFPFDR